MARIASIGLVAALVVATVIAFVVTQRLKLQLSPIFGTKVQPVFSPVCGCVKSAARISFRLRTRDRIDVLIVKGSEVVRTITRQTHYPKGRVVIEWDGRDDVGNVLPEGEYQPRVRFERRGFTVTLPNPIRIDVSPPLIKELTFSSNVVSPDGDGRRDRIEVRYRLNEPGRGALLVNGHRWGRGTLFARNREKIFWTARRDGTSLRPGSYSLQLVATDRAGNRSRRTRAVQVVVRNVALSPRRINAVAGSSIHIFVAADAHRVRWTLGKQSGYATPGRLTIQAPQQKGRYTLTVSTNGHAASAAVFVRESER